MKRVALLPIVVPAVVLVILYVASDREVPPLPAPTVTNRPVASPSPVDLSTPTPAIHIASAVDAPAPIAIVEPAVRGWIVDSAGGPIADAAVTIHNNEYGIHTTFTDRSGYFAVGGLQKAAYRVGAQKEHYNEAIEEDVASGRGEVRLVLTDMSMVTGTVSDESGNPVASFELVYLKQPPDEPALWREIVRSGRTGWIAVEDLEGCFEVSDIASGAPFAIGARAKGFEPAFAILPGVAPGETAPPAEIVLKTEGRVSGQVLSPGGGPVAGAFIHLGPGVEAPVVAESDVDGRFILTGLGDAEIELTASHDAYLAGAARVLPKRGIDVLVEIALGQGGELEGTVWKGDAAAAGQTVVALRLSPPRIRKQAVTDAEGRYTIAGIGLGLVDVLAKWKGPDSNAPPQRLRRQAEIAAGGTTVVDFHFPEGVAVLEGNITSNSEAVAFAEIQGTVATDEGQSSFSFTARDDGFFRIENIVPGTAWVRVTARAGQAERQQSFAIELREGETAYHEVSFDTASGVEGQVSNLAPGEVGQVLVLPGHESVDTSTFEAILELDGIKSGESEIDGTGRFTIIGLEPGLYTIIALVFSEDADTGAGAMGSVRIAVQPITVPETSTASATLTLSP